MKFLFWREIVKENIPMDYWEERDGKIVVVKHKIMIRETILQKRKRK